MPISAYKEAVDRTGIADLTLFNTQGESLKVGPAVSVTRLTSGKLKFKWMLSNMIEHQAHPFNYVALHTNRVVYDIRYIKPVFLGDARILEFEVNV